MADPAVVYALDSVIDEATGQPVQEQLFSNYNNQTTVHCDGVSLVGRSAEDRGVVKRIEVVLPLRLVDDQLRLADEADTIDGGTF